MIGGIGIHRVYLDHHRHPYHHADLTQTHALTVPSGGEVDGITVLKAESFDEGQGLGLHGCGGGWERVGR